ncbi:MAG: glycosyltransferase [Gammaproteobacteria bacterium]|nr:glycosyltransferase [Gammaproteobacteria bacterium]
MIDTTGPGGAETVFVQLADKLRDLGFNSIVAIRGPGWVEDELIKRNLNYYIIPAKGSFAFGFLYRLVRLINKHNISLIQSHLLGSNVYAAMAGLLSGRPVVATYHGMVDVDPDERFKTLKNRVMAYGISHYIAVSQRLLSNIDQQELLDITKASVIYNGVDTNLTQKMTKQVLRQELELPDNSTMIGSLGNVRPAKSYDVLIDAGARLIEKDSTLHFIIAGHKKPSLMQKLERQLNHLGVEDHFHFIGFISDTAEYLSQLDLFVLSSSSEGFSIATIEAMAAELPVLVTRCGGPEEIVTSGKNGIMVEPDNPVALSKGLEMLLNDKPLQKQIAREGRKHVETVFSIETMLEKYKNIYSRLLSKYQR